MKKTDGERVAQDRAARLQLVKDQQTQLPKILIKFTDEQLIGLNTVHELTRERKLTKMPHSKLVATANKYKSRESFRLGNPLEYGTASTRGVLDKICAHMTRLKNQWTNEEIQTEANKFNSRIDFQKGSEKVYQYARKKGKEYLDKVCSHMTYRRYPQFPTFDAAVVEMKKAGVKSEPHYKELHKDGKFPNLPKSPAQVYSEEWKGWHFITGGKIGKNSDEEIIERLKKYTKMTELLKHDKTLHNIASHRGKKFFDSATAHIERACRKWSDEDIFNEVAKSKNRNEFLKLKSSLLQIIERRKLHKEIYNRFPHLAPVKNFKVNQEKIVRYLKKRKKINSREYATLCGIKLTSSRTSTDLAKMVKDGLLIRELDRNANPGAKKFIYRLKK